VQCGLFNHNLGYFFTLFYFITIILIPPNYVTYFAFVLMTGTFISTILTLLTHFFYKFDNLVFRWQHELFQRSAVG